MYRNDQLFDIETSRIEVKQLIEFLFEGLTNKTTFQKNLRSNNTSWRCLNQSAYFHVVFFAS